MGNESRLIVSTPDSQGVWHVVYMGPTDSELEQFHEDGLCDRFCQWCWDEAANYIRARELARAEQEKHE